MRELIGLLLSILMYAYSLPDSLATVSTLISSGPGSHGPSPLSTLEAVSLSLVPL